MRVATEPRNPSVYGALRAGADESDVCGCVPMAADSGTNRFLVPYPPPPLLPGSTDLPTHTTSQPHARQSIFRSWKPERSLEVSFSPTDGAAITAHISQTT